MLGNNFFCWFNYSRLGLYSEVTARKLSTTMFSESPPWCAHPSTDASQYVRITIKIEEFLLRSKLEYDSALVVSSDDFIDLLFQCSNFIANGIQRFISIINWFRISTNFKPSPSRRPPPAASQLFYISKYVEYIDSFYVLLTAKPLRRVLLKTDDTPPLGSAQQPAVSQPSASSV